MLTDGTGRYCNGGLHSLFTSCGGLRSVFWTFFVIKKCCDNDVVAFAKLSYLTYVCTVTDENMLVVVLNLEKGFFAVALYYWH